jgi:hypothetical protein
VHVISESQVTERFAKLSMIFKALTFNKSIMKHNFQPYIAEIIKKLMKLTKAMLQDLDFDKPQPYLLVTVSNLLNSLSFDMHASSMNEKTKKDLIHLMISH